MENNNNLQQQPHSKYKTTLCKHWEQEKECSRGDSCHFGHGETEIRQAEENLPAEDIKANSFQFLQNNWNSGQPHNFKSVLCKSFKETGECKFSDNCSFAHGTNELRKPDSQQQNTQQMQALQQQLQQTIYQYNIHNAQLMLKYQQQFNAFIKELDSIKQYQIIHNTITNAKHFNTIGNLHECQEILNKILLKEDVLFSNEADQAELDRIRLQYKQQRDANKSQGIYLPMQTNLAALSSMSQMMSMGGMNMIRTK